MSAIEQKAGKTELFLEYDNSFRAKVTYSLTKQLHYAALDAAVLLPIYNSIALNVTPASPKLTDLKEYMVSSQQWKSSC